MVDVPPVLGLLWGRGEPGRRGPKRSLDIERIGRAAVEVADTEGFAAVSMKRVAAELGVSAMALYRYVESREDLHTVMLEVASGAPRRKFSRDWRRALEEWGRDYRALLLAHPWMLEVPLSGPPATPRQLEWMEASLVALDRTGLTAPEQMAVLLQLNVYVRGDVALALSVVGEDVSTPWAQLVSELAPNDRYPALHAIIASGDFSEDDDPTEQFEFGLARTLDGIEQLVRSRLRAR